MTPASLGIVTFRRHPPGSTTSQSLDRINANLAEGISDQGDVFVSTGRVRGRYVLRLCILNHSTSQRRGRPRARAGGDAAGRRAHRAAPRRASSYPPIDAGLAAAPGARRARRCARCRCSPRSSDELGRRACCNAAREHHAIAGEPIVEQWQVSRDLYVVLDGDGRGHGGRDAGARPRPGEFFGELAAVDWGAGFGRTRTATVSATRAHAAARAGLGARQAADERRARVRRAARAGVARAPRATLTLCPTSHTASRASRTVSS